MKYKKLVDVYESLAATTKRLEKTSILSEFFKEVDIETLPKVVLMALGTVFPPWCEEEQGLADKLLMKSIANVVGVSINKVEDQVREQGDIGGAAEELYKNKSQTTFFFKPLEIDFVFNNLRKLAKISGDRSTSRKIAIVLELLSSATATEAKYISRTIIEELRIGVGEGTIRDAISQAFEVEKSVADRAHMLTNDLGLVAKVAKEEGENGLKKLNLSPGKPVKPMLAQLSEGIAISVEEMGEAICETKYDGIRVQIHKKNDKINLFTRRLENISKAIPEMVDYIRESFPNQDFIAEGEIIATKNNNPISFQYMLQRVRRKYNIEKAIEDVPLKLYLFDLLYFKEPMIDKPLEIRRATLESIVKTEKNQINLSKMIKVTSENISDAQILFNESISKGHEGIMIKNPKEPYIPGIRGKKMLKFKAEPETLDVVVVGGTYGVGKRASFIGSYKVALADENGDLKTLAHVATGLDDETLAELTNLMKKYKIVEKGTKIDVEPRIILEIAYSEIVKSPEYEAGYSLRFPVVKRIREDKGLSDIDTVERLKSMFKG
ncbi:DNA ligase [Methanobrevibacter arboriphilus]|jgi:DNA ligase-1|uniref:DNA ligase n=1 Tax=Methanobrevibacter arboriphilus TaxID=39441 RepID=A0ACA8R4E8_METAZ|nr:ATP-dependent DNA ligase [Methanobrevibacter arboriphilus]MCC7562348.1 ATP-dependent DNA ligase [Methanobrevibacter arboriphilus]BBL61919.1 DNA ligase [Methanobrevibacter arboriphilus]GLI11031.1 DNA ligase [Methanobrevibacter arboriphilus]